MYEQITKIEMLIAAVIVIGLIGVDIIKIAGKFVSAILIASF